MQVKNLIIFLIMGIFASEVQAMSPRKGGATGGVGTPAGPDLAHCKFDEKIQYKIPLKTGESPFECQGLAVCGKRVVPTSCRGTMREPCPTAVKCVQFPHGVDSPIDYEKEISLEEMRKEWAYFEKLLKLSPYNVSYKAEEIKPTGKWRWVTHSPGQPIPEFAESGGFDPKVDKFLYICRASFEGGMHPGKIWLGGNCLIPFGGREIPINNYEILVRGEAEGRWERALGTKGRRNLGIGTGGYGPDDRCAAGIGGYGGFSCRQSHGNPPLSFLSPADKELFKEEVKDSTFYSFKAGWERDGKPLKICRALFYPKGFLNMRTSSKGVHPGKIINGACYLPYGGKEEAYGYEIEILFVKGQFE